MSVGVRAIGTTPLMLRKETLAPLTLREPAFDYKPHVTQFQSKGRDESDGHGDFGTLTLVTNSPLV
jgi:hypothetical protein